MISSCAVKNKAWLTNAFRASTDRALAQRPNPSTKQWHFEQADEETMQTLQYAWDASSQLTSDAGILAQQIIRSPAEPKGNHDLAHATMDILRKLGPPSQELLTMLSLEPRKIKKFEADKLLDNCARMFLELENNHQTLIEKTQVLARKQKSEQSRRMQALK